MEPRDTKMAAGKTDPQASRSADWSPPLATPRACSSIAMLVERSFSWNDVVQNTSKSASKDTLNAFDTSAAVALAA